MDDSVDRLEAWIPVTHVGIEYKVIDLRYQVVRMTEILTGVLKGNCMDKAAFSRHELKEGLHEKMKVKPTFRYWCNSCLKFKKRKRFPTAIDPVEPACIKCATRQEETKIES